MLRMAGVVDFANWADVPLAVDMNMAKVVAFEAQFMVTRVVTGEWGIDGYAMDSPRGIDFMMKFSMLEGQLDLGGERGGRSGWERLGVGGRSQFLEIGRAHV